MYVFLSSWLSRVIFPIIITIIICSKTRNTRLCGRSSLRLCNYRSAVYRAPALINQWDYLYSGITGIWRLKSSIRWKPRRRLLSYRDYLITDFLQQHVLQVVALLLLPVFDVVNLNVVTRFSSLSSTRIILTPIYILSSNTLWYINIRV